MSIGGKSMSMDELQIGAGMPDFDKNFYRPKQHPALGTAMEAEIDYSEERIANHTKGEKALLGMLTLGGALRFLEKLYSEREIDFQTRRIAGRMLCDRYEDLRRDAYIWNFSRSNSENAENEGAL